jgi:hypothetical protein
MSTKDNSFDSPAAAAIAAIERAAGDSSFVSLGGRRTRSVHEFYRYPARFSPVFARAVIEAFTKPGDVILDPFLGGGTTLVEARLSGRIGVGSDLSTLAVFVSHAKTRAYKAQSCEIVDDWAGHIAGLKLRGSPISVPHIGSPEARVLYTPETWRLRKFIGLALDSLQNLEDNDASTLARCSLLRTAQSALDMRAGTPTIDDFRRQLVATARAMANVASDHGRRVRHADAATVGKRGIPRSLILNHAAEDLPAAALSARYKVPRLVLTSPPYPGVYVMYHRWKVNGRKETGAPFWIANCLDGHGIGRYTMGARADKSRDRYFETLRSSWERISEVVDERTWVVQLVGFNHVPTQLPRYLQAMDQAGFREVQLPTLQNQDDGRFWRSVPSRRWWVITDARSECAPSTAREVVLVHKRA